MTSPLTPEQVRAARGVLLTVEETAPGEYLVTGGKQLHVVTSNPWACDCPDFAYRRAKCKHQLAVILHRGAAPEATE